MLPTAKHSNAMKPLKHRCEYPGCTKEFTRSSYLDRHVQVHTGEYVCPLEDCTRRFTVRGNLKRHMYVHRSGQFSFKCSDCRYSFLRMDHLALHNKHEHGNISSSELSREQLL